MAGRIWAVALNTFREAVRDRILYLLLIVGLAAVVFSKLLGDISVGDQLHVVADTGLTAVSLLGVMISIFVGTGLIHKEIDKRTIYTILSKPVLRGEFVLGKYLGLLMTSAACTGLLSAGFLAYYPAVGGKVGWPMAVALLFIMVEVGVITAMAVMFSCASTPILSAVLTAIVFAAGRMVGWIPRLIDHLNTYGEPGVLKSFLLHLLCVIAPNLEILDLRDSAVNAVPLPGDLGWRLIYAAVYASLMLLTGTLVFRRRRF
jgi:ABC-type transport system involved in multi-copper enzyme maturation permease subunit